MRFHILGGAPAGTVCELVSTGRGIGADCEHRDGLALDRDRRGVGYDGAHGGTAGMGGREPSAR